jgi:hypothetical protein
MGPGGVGYGDVSTRPRANASARPHLPGNPQRLDPLNLLRNGRIDQQLLPDGLQAKQ